MKLITLLICISVAACSNTESEKFDLIISNVNLIDGTGTPLQKAVNVYINENKIVKIDEEDILARDDLIDGTNKYLIPGLIDSHTHPNPYIENFPRFSHYGVTSILVTGCSLCTDEYYAKMRKMGEQDSLPAPRVFNTSQHFTMEGRHPVKTYTSSNWVAGKTIHLLKDTLQIESLIKELAENPIVGIKLTIEDGPFPPFVERIPQDFVNKIVEEANKYDLEVFAHASDNIEFMMALNAGVQNNLHYLEIDLDFEGDSTIINKLKRNGATVVTTFMLKKSWLYPLHPDWVKQLAEAKIYDAEEIQYLNDPSRKDRALRILRARKYIKNSEIPSLSDMLTNQFTDLRFLDDNNINIVLGTDTGNDFILPGISLHEEMQIMELGGFTPLEIIKMATHNAAKMLKQLDSLGTIEVGKYADMILLDRNPLDSISNTLSINRVIKNGRIQERMN
jgi:imidazolonepropionase-like amidohydrolase